MNTDQLISNSNTFKEHKDNAVVLSWIHSHVAGNNCFLSSVDVHTQWRYQIKYGIHVLALVMELSQNDLENYDFYELSCYGRLGVKHCTQSGFHSECHDHKY